MKYKSGIYGVPMSEEIAIGKYVRETVAVLNDMFESVKEETVI